MPGDNAWNDSFGDGILYPNEGSNQFTDGTIVPFETCLEPNNPNNYCGDENVIFTNPQAILLDCGLDGLCEGADGWTGPDLGEGNGQWDVFDYNYGYTTESECINNYNGVYYEHLGLCGNGIADQGDDWTDINNDNIFTFSDDNI